MTAHRRRQQLMLGLLCVMMASSCRVAHSTSRSSLLQSRIIQAVNSSSSSSWTTGSASYFDGPTEGLDTVYTATIKPGSCGYGSIDMHLWPFHGIVGVSPNSSIALGRPVSGCGTCLAIKCVDSRSQACVLKDGQPVIINTMVVDTCPTCNITTLNLHVFAFNNIALSRFGSVEIAYQQVPCTPPGGLTVIVDRWQAINGSWIRLVVGSVAGDGGINSVQMRAASTAPTTRTSNGRGPSQSDNVTTTPANGENDPGTPSGFQHSGVTSGVTAAARPSSSNIPTDTNWRTMVNTYGAVWEVSNFPVAAAAVPWGYDLRVVNTLGQEEILRNALPTYSSDLTLPHTYSLVEQFDAAVDVPGISPTGGSGPGSRGRSEAGARRLRVLRATADVARRGLQAGQPSTAFGAIRYNTLPRATLIIPEDLISGNFSIAEGGSGTVPSAAPEHVTISADALKPDSATAGGLWLPNVNGTTSSNTTIPINSTIRPNTTIPINSTIRSNTTRPMNGTIRSNTTRPINGNIRPNTTRPINDTSNPNGTISTNGTCVCPVTNCASD